MTLQKHRNIITHLESYITPNLTNAFINEVPIPLIILDNFLPVDSALELEKELDSIPTPLWKKFTRRNSYMEEYNKLYEVPIASNLVNQLHSSPVIKLLEQLSGIQGLIPDPHLIGAGYSRIYKNNSLKIHTDFNWNDELRAHRALSLIIYLNSAWKEEYGGNLAFKDKNNDKIVKSIPSLFNRAVIWKHDKLGFHGSPDPLECPETTYRKAIRFFFYTSNSTYNDDDLPHRSLYWYNEEEGFPYDIRT